MYSGWSPFFRVKFWKKEFVGRGVERSFGEKNTEGSGRTEDCTPGKRKGQYFVGFGGDIGGDGDGEGDGDFGGLQGFLGLLKGFVIRVLTFLPNFFNIFLVCMQLDCLVDRPMNHRVQK